MTDEQLRRFRAPFILIALAIGVLYLPASKASPETSRKETPKPGAMVEKVGVRLILLDVEVRDKNGRPLHGLKKEDFKLKLDYKEWPVSSVDDLCACEDTTPKPPKATRTSSQAGPAPAIEKISPGDAASEPTLYVLYLDFSQLQLDGRMAALRAAKRWLRETRKPDDEAMLEAYATVGGLRELCPPTRDAVRLEAALNAASGDRTMVDTFANGFFDRIEECDRCVKECAGSGECIDCVNCCPCQTNAMEEYFQGRRSLKALQQFLGRLEDLPGRKAVLFFHENEVLFPGDFYPLPDPTITVGTHEQLLAQVGAEATTSRAAVYPIQTGDSSLFNPLASAAVNLGANLADFTGGAYNRSPSDLFKVIDGAARQCACIYRIGFEPPEVAHARIYQARLDVAGASIPYRYRVQFLTEDDRLGRKARFVLTQPGSASEVPLVAALEPVAAGKRTWSLSLRLALDVDAMSVLPIAGSEAGQVDVGALLYRNDGSKSWEMLTGSKVRKGVGTAQGSFILYERTIQDVPPGEYRLTAFARTPDIDLFGGAEASLTLPQAGEPGLIGPIASSPKRQVYTASLPLRNEPIPDAGEAAQARTGTVPVRLTELHRGTHLELTTWLCPADGASMDNAHVVRFVARDGLPIFRLPAYRLEPAGRCFRLTDIVGTDELNAGRYSYHIDWKPAVPADGRTADLSFEIVEPGVKAAVESKTP